MALKTPKAFMQSIRSVFSTKHQMPTPPRMPTPSNPTKMSALGKFGLKATGFVGIGVAAKSISALMSPGLPAIPPGAVMGTGKRGIDSNNLNSSGVGLAMYRNRRR